MRNAIALLVTLLFIMLITISIGISLKQVNIASSYVQDEKFLYQSSIILDDIINILNTSPQLQDINSSTDLNYFLSQSSFIPFEAYGVKVIIKISSARSKFNINNLVDASYKQNKAKVDSLRLYMTNHMIPTTYVDILLDAMSGIKEDMSYNSGIFNQKSNLFRDYIASEKHLEELNNYYRSYYREDSLKNINFKQLFSYSKNNFYRVDLNFATPEVWELMLGCDKQRANELSLGLYESVNDIDLSKEEKKMLSRFNTSTFEKFLKVHLSIIQNTNHANINFEYDIKNKKGSHFVYEI